MTFRLGVGAPPSARLEQAHLQAEQLHATERLGHLAAYDREREPLHDGRLAHTRLADEHGVVLAAAAEHVDHALDRALTADHRIELTFQPQAARREDKHLLIASSRYIQPIGVFSGRVRRHVADPWIPVTDLLGVTVRRPAEQGTTALGAAYLAGIAEGVWASPAEAAAACLVQISAARRLGAV